jgi:hypothetical protein
MSFFALSPGREREVRLAFSYTTPDQIEEGIRRLARYVGYRIAAEEGDGVSGGYPKSLSAASAEGAAR